jgi:hypothetical protein
VGVKSWFIFSIEEKISTVVGLMNSIFFDIWKVGLGVRILNLF